MVELKQNEELIDGDIVPASKTMKCLTWNFPKPEKNLLISFKTSSSADFYSISLTGNTGIAVNNIPLRGSSGLEFTKCNSEFLGNFYKALNVKLLLLQFGVNMVPNVTENYQYYEKSFQKQLEYLKKTCRDVPIVVIGVSDVARNTIKGFESYPNIEKIRDAQKNATFAAGYAFWDMLEAMGGLNSMPSWVNANPPLAQKDYVHLSPAGAKIIGEILYRSLINDYENFLSQQQNPL
jgi:lysophospholipase L1-like esterase